MEYAVTNRNWLNIKLGDFATRITKGGTPTTYGFSFQKKGINFVKVENVKNGEINIQSISDFISEDAHAFQLKSQLSADDILFSIAGTIGETCIVKKTHLPANTNQALAIIKGTSKYIIPSLLKFQLDAFVAKVKAKARGGAMNNVSLEDLKNLFVNIPPPNEQIRLLAKMEELFSSLDKGNESLKTAQQQLKVYRQAVLEWAFEGRLTGDSEKWGKTTLGEIFSISSGNGLTKATRNDGGQYLVYGGNGVAGNHSEYMYEEEKLIIGRVGVHCGNVHITKPKSWITDNAFVVSFNEEEFAIKYLHFLIISLNLNRYSSSTAQPVISQGKVYPIKIAVPKSKEEQNAIVAEIESRLSVCDKIEESIEQSLKQSEALRQSILKKAFEGRLVPQDPSDEPASKLLERIKAERQNNKIPNPLRRRPGRAKTKRAQ